MKKSPKAKLSQPNRTVSIIGTRSYVPERILSNADLEAIVETTDQWIMERTGIRERRIAKEGEFTSHLAAEAAKRALENAGVTALDIDLILVMSVNPGFGGQSFISSQLRKIETLRKMVDDAGRDIILEVDGGVTRETARQCIAAGATALVAGTAVFKGGASAYAENIAALRS